MNTGVPGAKPPAFKPPPTSSSKPKPPQPKQRQGTFNAVEMIRDEAKEAGKQVIEAPGQMVQEAADQMWAALLGVENKPKPAKKEGEKEPDDFTKLNLEKLNAAYARQDMAAVQTLQQDLQEHNEEKAANAAQHRQFKQAEERAIEEIKVEEQKKKQEELEEEQKKKQEEEEERLAQQNSNASDGAAKSKGQLGKARPKASTDQVFEQGRKKG